MNSRQDTRASTIALYALSENFTVGVAESLTGGGLAMALAKAPNASEWFKGGVVAYQRSVKDELLGVSAEQVVSARCAKEMAAGAQRVLGADLTLSATGIAGPDPVDDQSPGTVFIAAQYGDREAVAELHVSGSPEIVCVDTISSVIDLGLALVLADQPSGAFPYDPLGELDFP